MKTYNKEMLKKDLNGVDFLRHCVEALNNRNEYLNQDKTPQQLINDFLKMVNDKTENEKHVFKFFNGRYPEKDE